MEFPLFLNRRIICYRGRRRSDAHSLPDGGPARRRVRAARVPARLALACALVLPARQPRHLGAG